MVQELGTSGNLDGQQRLIVKGRFLPKGFENVIRRYMNEYVLCASCKSPDTLLDRDAGAQRFGCHIFSDHIAYRDGQMLFQLGSASSMLAPVVAWNIC